MLDHDALPYYLRYDCPQCDRPVLHVSHSTEEQVRTAAGTGDPDAIDHLATIERQKRYAQDVVASRLHDASQLGEPSDEMIDVTFRLNQRESEGTELVILANGHQLHREVIHYESLEPLERLVPLLRQRYQDRLRSIDPSGANLYFLGDRLTSVDELNAILGPLQRTTPMQPS